MKIFKITQGQNLLEAILAIAIFLILITGSMMLTLQYLDNVSRAKELLTTKIILEETNASIEGIAANDWASLTDGTFGLIKNNGYWELSGTSDIIENKYTRSLTISEVQRNDECTLVENGGTPDPDTKNITVNVNWNTKMGEQQKSFNRLISNWQNPTNCTTQGEAGSLVLDVSISNIDATKKSLVNTFLRNEGSVPITIDKFTLTWTAPGNITYIKIETTNHWHATSGIGLPSGEQPSGTEMDIVDFTLEPGQTYEIDSFRFDEKVDGSTFTITATMSDGTSLTQITTPPFIP